MQAVPSYLVYLNRNARSGILPVYLNRYGGIGILPVLFKVCMQEVKSLPVYLNRYASSGI